MMLHNLVANAVRHHGDRPAPRVEVGMMGDGKEPVFFVRDNGVGIDSRYHRKVFELFERLDASAAGTGVGLALAKRIVEGPRRPPVGRIRGSGAGLDLLLHAARALILNRKNPAVSGWHSRTTLPFPGDTREQPGYIRLGGKL